MVGHLQWPRMGYCRIKAELAKFPTLGNYSENELWTL